MSKLKDQERRISNRKKCYIPIKLVTNKDLTLVGYAIDISCYGIRIETTFKIVNKKRLLYKILSNPNITVELVEIGDQNPLILKAPLDIIWNKYTYLSEKETYEIGFVLYLNEEQQQAWNKFYNTV